MNLKKQINKSLRIILWAVLVFSLVQCSTKKNTFTRRVFHNLTGHYNLFWNGRESLREGEKKLSESLKENYNKIIYVFNYGKAEDASLINSYADVAIEKASLNIDQHSMYFEHEEKVRWIDDSYLLIGKAYFYKHEYRKAKRTFNFIITKYAKNPIRFEAALWLAKTYIQMEKYGQAASTLSQLMQDIKGQDKLPKNIERDIHLNMADMYLHQEKWDQAIDELNQSLKFRMKKDMKARVWFILAQLYQQSQNYPLASDLYNRVIKKNPPYEMAIRAAINRAQCYDIEKNGIKDVEKQLKKLLREEKNKDYRDQIYYALGQLEFRVKNDTLGIAYLRLSVANSTKNNFQKATSCLELGDRFFKATEYPLAQAYYDTAMQVLPKDYPNYEGLKRKSAALNELVSQLMIIHEQDSLQALAKMSKEELMKLIDEKIKEYEDFLAEQKQQAELAKNDKGEGLQDLGVLGNQRNAKWYFYNDQTVAQGKKQFERKWGKRILEDFWRISDKQSMRNQEEGNVAMNDSTALKRKGASDPMSPEYYLKNIPFEKEQWLASDSLIEEAYFALGNIYLEKMEDSLKTIQTFEKLLLRFPRSKHRLLVYYSLYNIFSDRHNTDKSEYYKTLILKEFPDSDYAKIIKDPEYYKQLQDKMNVLQDLYAETYEHYTEGHYFTVNSNAEKALSKYTGPKSLLAKFAFLKALAQARLQKDSLARDSLVVHLKAITLKYKGEEIIPKVQKMLQYLDEGNKEAGAGKQKDSVQYDLSIYHFNPREKQMLGVVIREKGKKVNIEALKTRFTDFNNKGHKTDNLSVSNIMLDKKTHFLIVGSFPAMPKAMLYYSELVRDDYVLSMLKSDDYDIFVIGQKNYPVFYKDKDAKKYLAFFEKYYLKKKKK